MGLYALYRTLQAPAKWLKHCFDLLDARISAALPSFFLIPRGSVFRGLGLRGTADLDVDLILPRDLLDPERLEMIDGSEVSLLNEARWSNICNCLAKRIKAKDTVHPDGEDTEFVELGGKAFVRARDIAKTLHVDDINYDGIESHDVNIGVMGHVKVKRNASSRLELSSDGITRSISGKLWAAGIKVDVDIFPKLLNSNGTVCSITSRNAHGKRTCTWEPFYDHKEIKDFSDVEKAVILFIKRWKLCVNQDDIKLLKGYHLAIAMEHLITKSNMKLKDREKLFSFEPKAVIRLIALLLAVLLHAYSTNDDIEDLQPLRIDTDHKHIPKIREFIQDFWAIVGHGDPIPPYEEISSGDAFHQEHAQIIPPYEEISSGDAFHQEHAQMDEEDGEPSGLDDSDSGDSKSDAASASKKRKKSAQHLSLLQLPKKPKR
jgi:hypothetical protein